VISASSVNTFKERLDKYWANYCYTLDPEDFLRRQTGEQPTGLIGLKSVAESKGYGKDSSDSSVLTLSPGKR